MADGSAATFYLGVFYFLTDWWTSGVGIVLALITCSSIFPEMILQGGIDALLSKPITRGKLFLTKYLSGLLFAGSLAVVLAAVAWLCIRWKWATGTWKCGGVCLWCWCCSVRFIRCWFSPGVVPVHAGIGHSDADLLGVVLDASSRRTHSGGVGAIARVATMSIDGGPTSADDERAAPSGNAETARKIFKVGMLALPKTTEMNDLIRRSVETQQTRDIRRENELDAEIEGRKRLLRMAKKPMPSDPLRFREDVERELTLKKLLEKLPGYIIGTTLAFQALILLWAGWIFCGETTERRNRPERGSAAAWQARPVPLRSRRREWASGTRFWDPGFRRRGENWSVALAFPLVAAPELKEAAGPEAEFLCGVAWKLQTEELETVEGSPFVADGSAFDGVEHGIRHEVGFVRLSGTGRAEFGGGLAGR